MTPLRKRMFEDMQLRGLAPSTQQQYISQVAGLAIDFYWNPKSVLYEEEKLNSLPRPSCI